MMKKLKLFFACLLMAVLSIGQVWGESVTYTVSSATAVSTTGTAPDGSSATLSGTGTLNSGWIQCTAGNGKTLTLSGYEGNKITAITIYVKSNASKGGGSFSVVAGSTTLASIADSKFNTTNWNGGWNSTGVSKVLTMIEDDYEIQEDEGVVLTLSASANSLYIQSYTITYEEVGGDNASVSADPESVTNVAFAGVTNQTIDLTYENITDYETEVSVHPNEDGTGTLSPAWLTASVTDADDYATVTYSVAANTGAARTAYIKVYTTDGDKEAETIIPVSQVKYSAPTGTFELFSGDIEEGDYVLVGYQTSSSKYYAMNSTVTSNQYLGITEVSIDANDQIVNPDASLVWTIEQSTNGYYIKQGFAYLDDNATSNKNYAQTVAEPTTTSEWTFAYDNTWTITNYGTETTKKTLSFNISASRVACYTAIQSGNTCFYLYKKVDGAVKPSAGLAFDAAQKLAKVDGTLTAPNLSTADGFDGTVTYASSDEAVVKVNASTGAITEIVAAGKAVITAHSDETENFKEGSASYTIFVAEQAGTNEDPLTEASAKALIDLGCTLTVHVNGLVLSQNSTNFTVTLTNGFQFYKAKDLNNVAFESAYLGAGDEVTAVGALKKFSSTYELDEGCYLTFYEAATTPLTPIANDKDHPYTVAQALAFAAAPTTYDLSDHVFIQGVVYKANSFNSDNGTYNIYIKDAGTSEDDGKFEFYKCAGLYQVGEDVVPFAEGDVQEGDEVIGYGVMSYYSGGSIWQFGQPNQLVSLNRPEVAVTGVELNKESTSLEVGETETLVATVAPANATNKAVTWASDDETVATVDENGVVTAVAEGTTTITVTTVDGSFTDDCEVTVTAADPTVHHVTFIAGTDQSDETSITKDGITISASTFNNASYYQCYSGAAMTVSSTVGNITKIELTCTTEGTAKYGPGNWDFTGYSYSGANGSWTGSAETVEFGNASQQVRMTLITVTYKEDNREAAGLAWNPADDIEITVGDAFSAPALQNPNSIDASEISIESSNTSLATVTAGVVSLVADATGTATITATFNGNASYKPATVSYNITVNEASLDNVTFDSSEDHAESGETTITKSGFTLSFTSGSMDGTQAEYRLYKSQTMTLSSTDYLIKKIEFTCTSGNPISGFADAEGLDKDNNQWTGQANSVELTASNAQVRIEKLKVYYIEDTRAVSGLAWSTDEIEITLGDAFTPATLNNPNSIDASAITIESDNTDLAIVTAGVVSLEPDKIGTAHITATFAGNETYKPATVSYTIIVNDPNPEIITNPTTNLNFGSVEEGATITAKTLQVTLQNVAAATVAITGDGKAAFSVDETALTGNITLNVSASSANQGTFNATLTISDNASQATAKEISLSLTVTEPVVEDDVTGTWTLVTDATTLVAGKKVIIAQYVDADGAINTMAGQASNNRSVIASTVAGTTLTPAVGTKVMTLADAGEGHFYLMTSNGEYLYNASTSTKSYLKTKAEEENVSWTIAVDAEGVATITSVENTNRTKMRYNPNTSGSPLFNCYASGQNDIALYMHEDATPEPDYTEVRSGLEPGRYYTVCLPRKVVAVKGATFWTLEKKNMEGSQAYLEEETNNLPFAAGKPFIIQATANKLEVAYEGDATTTAGVNGAIHGTLTYMDADALDAAGPNVYLLYQNELRPLGENNHLDANRAYVKINELDAVPEAPQNAPGRRVVAMPMEKDVTTDINALNAAEAPVKMIIDGNLFILRGEKLYDATGRLVK